MHSNGGPMTDKQGNYSKEYVSKLFVLWLYRSIHLNYGNEKKDRIKKKRQS
jgi:hypothetical protein